MGGGQPGILSPIARERSSSELPLAGDREGELLQRAGYRMFMAAMLPIGLEPKNRKKLDGT